MSISKVQSEVRGQDFATHTGKMYKLTFLIMILFLSQSLWSREVFSNSIYHRSTIELKKGHQTQILVQNLKRYSIGNPIIKARYLEKEQKILIRALKKGKTDLWIWKRDGSILVQPIQILTKLKKTKNVGIELLKQIPNLEVFEVSKNKWLVRGIVRQLRQAQKIDEIIDQNKTLIINRIQVEKSLVKKMLLQNQSWLSSQEAIQISKNPLFVSAFVQSIKIQKKLKHELKNRLPLIPRKIEIQPLLNKFAFFSIYLLAVSRQSNLNLGTQWKLDSSPIISIQSSVENLSNQIKLNQSLGNLKILSKPELAINIPGEAELFSGTEIPIRQNTQYSSKLSWKNSGLRVKIKTISVESPYIQLKIKASVSQTAESGFEQTSGEAVPRIESNLLETHVQAEFQKTLMIGGLSQIRSKYRSSGIPFFSNLPLIGYLFGTKNKENDQSDLVILITPYRYSPKQIKFEEESLEWPLGPVPSPRNRMSLQKIQNLKESKDYPWNAL